MANCVKCGRVLPGFSFGKKLCSWCVQHEAAQRGLQPEGAVQRVESPPWLRRQSTSMVVTQVFFGINVAVYLAMLFAGVSMLDNPAGQDLVRWGANFGPLTLSGQYWRLLTCVFIHGGLLHIAFNMWCLWDLGALAESLYGHWTFAVVYLLAGVGGSLGSVIWNPNVLSVGASGAIFGIAGAVIASFYLGEFSLPRAAVAGTLRSVVVFVGYNLFFGAVIARVDNAAHIGGLVTGLLLGALIAKAAPDRDNPGQRVAVIALALLLIGGGAAWWLRSHDYMRHMQRGAGFLAENKTDQAIAEFQSVLRQHSDYPLAHFQLARAYGLKGDFANAETEFKRVLELNPQSRSTYYNLGYVYIEEKKLPLARETFQRLLAISSDSADAHFGLAEIDMVEEKYQDAIHEYQTAAQLEPDLQGVYYNLGRAQVKLSQFDDAIASFKREIEKSGDDYDTEIALANAYEAKGMKKEAADSRQKAAELTGKH
jgi:membrane associated rhomboid family serine protease/Tfp pilus assembly protein PilF